MLPGFAKPAASREAALLPALPTGAEPTEKGGGDFDAETGGEREISLEPGREGPTSRRHSRRRLNSPMGPKPTGGGTGGNKGKH